ncbi:MAG: hypothetical protein L0271_01920 [Gemmatimonadetes bacterium]|nr:hypothetical protein [Gemmatimonadota bacterium]
MTPRSGAVPLLLLLCIATGELIAAGSLLVATRALRASRTGQAVTAARAAAEAAVRSAIAGWDRTALDSIAIGDSAPLPAGNGTLAGGAQHDAVAERLTADRWLVRGQGWILGPAGPIASARAAALVLTIPLDTLWQEFGAAFASGRDALFVPVARIDGLASATPPPPWTASACPPDAASAMQQRLGFVARPGAAMAAGASLGIPPTHVTGVPAVITAAPRTDSASFQRLASLPLSDVARIADRIESGALALAPAASALACDTTVAGNWGAPAQPAHPCAGYFPLVFSPGDLSVTGGQGQGMLVVNGDLELSGATFWGAVLVTGTIRSTASTIHGGLRAGGGTGAPADLLVRHSACSLWRAFGQAPALRRAYRPPGRWWLPPL